MAPVLRSHVFVADSSCLASRTRPQKPKREFTKVFRAFAGSNNCRRREGKVLSLATGNSSPTKTALYASRPATLTSTPFAKSPPVLRSERLQIFVGEEGVGA